jgi:hypothetical protein
MRVMPRPRPWFSLAVVALLVATCGGSLAAGAGRAEAQSGGATVWIQTMDSCKQALGGAAYQLSGGGQTRTAQTPAGRKKTVSSRAACPLQQGSCTSVPRGCVSFGGLPPGTYTLTTTRPPAPDRSDPEGFAPCQGGSACRSQTATIAVAADGSVQATVTDVYPDGVSETFPTAATHAGRAFYAGTAGDPVVTHDFGLAHPGFAPQCDGDSDADDHLTGNMRAHCAYPEGQEASACQPYPWSCTLPAATAAPSPSPSPRTRH